MKKYLKYYVYLFLMLFFLTSIYANVIGGYAPDGNSWIWTGNRWKPGGDGHSDDGYTWIPPQDENPESGGTDKPKGKGKEKPKVDPPTGNGGQTGYGGGQGTGNEEGNGGQTGYGGERGKGKGEDGKGGNVDRDANEIQTGNKENEKEDSGDQTWVNSEKEVGFNCSGREHAK